MQTLPWHEPLAVVARLKDCQHLTLLYSGMQQQNSGRYSYLAWQPAYVHTASRFEDMPTCDETLEAGFPQWFGYAGYGMRHAVEPGLDVGEKSPVRMPEMLWIRYHHLLRFDHELAQLHYYCLGTRAPDTLGWLETAPENATHENELQHLASNMTRAGYEACVKHTTDAIMRGDFYQANITRKFYGHFTHTIDAISVFKRLCTVSPSPYSALMMMGENAVISSSPEGFIGVDAQRNICTRPIKGSAASHPDAHHDNCIQNALQASDKDLAENLMIVDLMRNDLARICTAGSVYVRELAQIYSYPTIHHLISCIEGQLQSNVCHGDIFKATFPPGSMTGAPKIAAMQWCSAQEKIERGVYSGVIGWLGSNASCDFSVLIRTLVTSHTEFEFQVGGGIVADSEPEKEWLETLAKARGIAQAIGLEADALSAL